MLVAYTSNIEQVIHVEPFFDPQAHTSRGIPFDSVRAIEHITLLSIHNVHYTIYLLFIIAHLIRYLMEFTVH